MNLSILLGLSILVLLVLGSLFMIFLREVYVLYSLGFVFLVVGVVSILIYLIKKFT